METVYITKDEFEYRCPYCGVEIVDYSKDEMESGSEYCGNCLEEYYICVATNEREGEIHE
jgi:hypothetical protein